MRESEYLWEDLCQRIWDAVVKTGLTVEEANNLSYEVVVLRIIKELDLQTPLHEEKPIDSEKNSPDQRTIHEIRAEFSNPNAKSQLLFCNVCDTNTRHTTPFFGYPFRCVINHDGTTRCHGCGHKFDFIARVIVTGQHEHKSYCVSCDEQLQREGEGK